MWSIAAKAKYQFLLQSVPENIVKVSWHFLPKNFDFSLAIIVRDGLSDHTTSLRCAIQLVPMLNLRGVKRQSKLAVSIGLSWLELDRVSLLRTHFGHNPYQISESIRVHSPVRSLPQYHPDIQKPSQ